jgi:hypothetical protein
MQQTSFLDNPATIQQVDPTPLEVAINKVVAVDAAPVIASPDDINRDRANAAFNGTSYSPEKRGQARRESYAEAVNSLYAEMWPLAKSEEQKEYLAQAMQWFKQGCLDRMNAYLASHTNVMSAMITGPARFPTARNAKRSQWADNKMMELCAFEKKGREVIKRRLLDLRPQEVKDANEWAMFARDIASSLGAIKGCDAGELPYNRSAFVNSIVGKVERLAYNGEVVLVEKALALVTEYNAANKKPAITTRHKFWAFAALAQAKAANLAQLATAAPQSAQIGEGFELVVNQAEDRLQILFEAIPSAEMRAKLKGEGWNWSPRNKAWQRKITDNARRSAQRILGIK